MKHFKINVTRNQIEFGQEIFFDIQSLLEHFDNCPLIGDDTGLLIIAVRRILIMKLLPIRHVACLIMESY